MVVWSYLRVLLLVAASLGYFANGAQAHVQISAGESLDLMICSTQSARTVKLEIPGEPAQETDGTFCGDCATPVAITPPNATHLRDALFFTSPVPTHLPIAVTPRSPLWPGAPPQGPPSPLKA